VDSKDIGIINPFKLASLGALFQLLVWEIHIILNNTVSCLPIGTYLFYI